MEFALKFKDKMIGIGDAYYELDRNGRPSGHPNCVKCWENNYKKRKLVAKPYSLVKKCLNCGEEYSRSTTTIKRKSNFFITLLIILILVVLLWFYQENFSEEILTMTEQIISILDGIRAYKP